MLYLAQSRNGPSGLRPDRVFLLFFFRFDHLTTLVMTAIRADAMGKAHLSTIWTLDQVLRAERIVRPAAVSAALGMFPFRLGSHGLSLLLFKIRPALRAGSVDYTFVPGGCQGWFSPTFARK